MESDLVRRAHAWHGARTRLAVPSLSGWLADERLVARDSAADRLDRAVPAAPAGQYAGDKAPTRRRRRQRPGACRCAACCRRLAAPPQREPGKGFLRRDLPDL